MEHDLVVRGGTVFDGLGGEPIVADIAIRDGEIAAIGQVPAGAGREEIDATGLTVTPGFVDVHTHYDGQITWENRLVPSSGHGVTTVVMGNCGVGFAPCRSDQHEMAIKLMEGVEDIPDAVLAQGVPWTWETFPDYLDALEQRQSDVDFAAQLPHSPLRVFVMGERGANLAAPTADELQEMRRLTAEAVQAGALGVSTSRHTVHRFRDGRPAPSVPTEDQEVLALAQGLRDAGDGVFQIVPNPEIPVADQFGLVRQIAVESGRPVSFTLTETKGDPEAWPYVLGALSDANEEGLEIRGQVLPRPPGVLLGLDLSYHPFSLNPSYKAIADRPLAEKLAIMKDPQFRRQLLAEEPEDPREFFRRFVSDYENMFVLGDPPNYNPARADNIANEARRRGLAPREMLYDVLMEREGHEILYVPMSETHGDHFEARGRELLGRPHIIPGLGDGGAHYGMICDAAYTTYLLTYWVRDATADRAIPLPRAIEMLTSEPAVTVGLNDRGILKPGYKADLNLIDLDRLQLFAPQVSCDLPAGGRRLSQKADGYVATIVSGQVTYRNGEWTGNLPGRLVRGSR